MITGPRNDGDHRQDPLGVANQEMRKALNEIDGVRAATVRAGEEVRRLREELRQELARVEREARERVSTFAPNDIGSDLRLKLHWSYDGHQLVEESEAGRLRSRDDRYRNDRTTPAPANFDAAKAEWEKLETIKGDIERRIDDFMAWASKPRLLRRKGSKPALAPELLDGVDRLSLIHRALPALREQVVADAIRGAGHLHEQLAVEVKHRAAELDAADAGAHRAIRELKERLGPSGSEWGTPTWAAAAPAAALDRTLRLGELRPALPGAAAMSVPALTEFPFSSGISIAADVAQRAAAIDLARSLIFRLLTAAPAGDVRFVFFDPVSLGQSVADLRHLAEFDAKLLDTKTWTSERDIEARLDELSDHLEVVISNYLRGQFASIDDYNRQAGEVAEPYRVLVVFDYPHGISDKAARQLLSLIENGPRCGVHTILLHDPTRPGSDGVPTERLVHSMQKVELLAGRGRLTLPEPLGRIDHEFVPDPAPPITFTSDGRPSTPYAQLLLDIGGATRASHAGPVTLERVLPVLNKMIATGRSPQVRGLGGELSQTAPGTWWSGTTNDGALAPIGRAGAQDVASMWFSSTEVAGGAVVVGIPRSGKSTALHAAILSLCILYPPEELELYLVDSKHGVEFKIYEQLPHARLVSINSEREFAVSVLQSLDGEIARRAELMKRRTAGKSNITEYRASTGEILPRIVLFMDEFHEVFEEDDALGQAAFAAFSNIVRQGPFAGVHLVVASQTLSSMPAMDRSTLSLLPMRVAFMCNEADADLVMGDQNREVKALSRQGEGILNPSRGEPSFNKPFRGMYIAPDERTAVLRALEDKAAHQGRHQRPRVFDGDTLAERPRTPPRGATTRPVFALGEPISLDPWAGITLRRGRGANLLLLGASPEEDDEHADPALVATVESCLLGAADVRMRVHVVDFLGDDVSADALGLEAVCASLGARYRRGAALEAVLRELVAETAARTAAADYSADGRLLVLNGLQRALDLAPEDPYADQGDEPDAASLLASLLRDGPDVGCHVLATADGLTQFDRRLSRDLLKEFEWRIGASGLSVTDINAITENFTEGEVRRSQLLLVDHARGRTRRLRAYPRLTATSPQLPTTTERNIA